MEGDTMFNEDMKIEGYDPELAKAIKNEIKRQEEHIELIASENYASPRVIEAQGSVLTNKYAEGYPGKRYYGGCENVDVAEQLAIDRLKEVYGADYANVQPHSGSQANAAVYLALLNAGDTILGMSLDAGGHLTHGSKVNFSGKLFNAVQYGIDDNGMLDYDEIESLAMEHKPKMLVGGFSAYSQVIDWERMSQIAKKVGAYFMVDTARPQSIVQFLAALMPQKKTAELYSSLGFFKHGKTVFYADFNAHLKHTSDLFRRAEGTQGLVMAVFKLESYQVVFKVIRDQFPASKNVTKAQVRRAYHLVKTHDRVGRMADTHEFLELCLPTNRFSEEVLEELLTDCSDCVSLDDGLVRLQHVYIERLMTPLNLYLPQASPIDQSLVLEDYGLAIKQLAAANI